MSAKYKLGNNRKAVPAMMCGCHCERSEAIRFNSQDFRSRVLSFVMTALIFVCLLLAACGSDSANAGNSGGSATSFSIGSGIVSSAESLAVFEAGSADQTPEITEILYFGDVQANSGLSDYEVVADLFTSALARHSGTDFALQCGDLVNEGSSPEEWDAFLSAATRSFSTIPLLTAPGNHEVSPYVAGPDRKPRYYLDLFTLPENGPAGYAEEYYSIDFGNVHVLSLSSNYLDPAEGYADEATENAKIATRIDAWIEDDLAGTAAPFKIVLMHQPAWPVVGDSTSAAMEERWIPLFEDAGVDLVLCGHQHEMMRTFAQRNGKDDESGVVQIMVNSSLKNYGNADGGDKPYIAFEMGGVFGYAYITATERKLTASIYDADGRKLDVWEREKQNERIQNP